MEPSPGSEQRILLATRRKRAGDGGSTLEKSNSGTCCSMHVSARPRSIGLALKMGPSARSGGLSWSQSRWRRRSGQT
eukprot:1915374-Pyramimonas_sp.AAC.1